MQIDLTGRSALVTGSTAGIGFAIAVGLAKAGADVVVNGRSPERTREAAARVAEEAGLAADSVRAVAADVGTPEGVAELVSAVPDVDVLVNNAGAFTPAPVFEIPDEEWDRVFALNVMSGVRLSRHHVPRMVQRGWGRAIFVSSESALQIPKEMVHYGMSKTAQLAVSRGMAESVAETGVTVNCILPGPTHTEGVEAMLGAADAEAAVQAGRDFVHAERPSSLLGRLIEPEEVANLTVYLASEQASATTGSALRVDGGVIRAAVG